MNKRILALFVHPDDETFGVGGTLAKYAEAGAEIVLVCATRGERGEELICLQSQQPLRMGSSY